LIQKVTGVSAYDSDEEQVEALKKWWSENGRSIVGGIVIGLGVVFGWQAWSQQQEQSATQASLRYERMAQAIMGGSAESALKQGEMIIADWPDSGYAAMAALDMAKIKLEQGDADGANTQYQWVLAHAKDPSLQQLARLRMARILLSKNDVAGAEAIVTKADKDNFAGEFAALRGDIARAKKDYATARVAYQEALDNEAGNQQLIQMKLDDLAAAKVDK
jgi:predicted negative regulator of RcsB-dependent stress response